VLETLVGMTCDGNPVSALFGCVHNGDICSNMGTCQNSVCVCPSNLTGTFCEVPVTTGSNLSGGAIGGIVVGVIVVLLLLAIVFIAFLLYLLFGKKKKVRRICLPLLLFIL